MPPPVPKNIVKLKAPLLNHASIGMIAVTGFSLISFALYYMVVSFTSKKVFSPITVQPVNNSDLHVPGTPTGLASNQITTNTVTLFWQTPAETDINDAAIAYIVSYQLQGTSQSNDATSWIQAGNTDKNMITIGGMIPNMRYIVRVDAINSRGANDVPATTIVQMLSSATQGNVPGNVTGAIVTATTNNSISLSWNAPSITSGSVGVALQYHISVQFAASGNITQGSWVDSGASIVTNFRIMNLIPGNLYNISIQPINNYGYGPTNTSLLGIATQSGLATGTSPSAVRSLMSSSTDTALVVLTWLQPFDLGNADAVQYHVEYRLNGTMDWFIVGTGQTSNTTINVTGLVTNSQYDFQVTCMSGFGHGPSTVLSSVSVLPNNGTPQTGTPPNTVGSLTGTPLSSTSIRLNWTASSGARQYVAEYQTSEASDWFVFNGNMVKSDSQTLTIFSLQPNTSYNARVFAINNIGISSPVVVNSIKTLVTQPRAPIASSPTSLTGTAQLGGTSVNLTWPIPQNALSNWQYKVYSVVVSSSDPMNFPTISPLVDQGITKNNTLLAQISLEPFTLYNFAVATINESGIESSTKTWLYNFQTLVANGNNNPTTGTGGSGGVTTGTQLPSAVIGFSGLSTWNSMSLSWQSPSSQNTAQYLVQYQSVGSSGWIQLSVLNPDQLSYNVSATTVDLTYPNIYNFRVIPINNSGGSGPASNISLALAPPAPTFINVPVCLPSTPQRLISNWAVVPYAVSYNVEVYDTSATSPAWSNVAKVNSGTTTYNIDNLKQWTTYNVRVAALNQFGIGPYVQQDGCTTLGFPGQPSDVVLGEITDTTAAITWTVPSNASTYQVQYQVFGEASWYIFSSSIGINSCTITGLTPGCRYFARVAAINATGQGPVSVASSVINLYPSNVTGLVANYSDLTSIGLSWSPASGATSYVVQARVTGSGLDGWYTSQTITTGINSVKSVVSALSPGVSYDFQVNSISSITGRQSLAPSPVVSYITQYDAPTGLTADVGTIAQTQIVLNWSSPVLSSGVIPSFAASQPTAYVVSYSANNGATWTIFATRNASTSCTVTGLIAGTAYLFQVTSYNDTSLPHLGGIQTLVVSSLANAPTGLVTSNPTINTFSLSWTSVSQSFKSYTVSIQDTSIITPIWSNFTTTTSTFCVVTGLIPGHVYQARICTNNRDNNPGPNSTIVTYGTLCNAPSSLTLNGSVTSSSSIPFIWGASTGVSTYHVSYQVTPTQGDDKTMANLTWIVDPNNPYNSSTLNGTLSSLSSGTRYTIQVVAVNVYGTSAPSQPLFTATLPSNPTSLTASVFTTTSITLTWPTSQGATAYYIDSQDVTMNGSWIPFGTAITTNSMKINGLIPNHTYNFRLSTSDQSGKTVVSSTLLTQKTGDLPKAPTAIAITNATSTSATVGWTVDSSDPFPAQSWIVMYQAFGSGSVVFTTVINSTTSVIVTGLIAGTLYNFSVLGTNTFGSGATIDSSSLGIPIGTIPSNTGTLTGTTIDNKTIRLNWIASSFGSSTPIYLLQYRITGSGSAWTTISGANLSDNFYQCTGLTSGTSYDWRVYAVNTIGQSTTPSLTTHGTTCTSPTNLVVSSNTSTSFVITWNLSSGANLYSVCYQTQDSGTTPSGNGTFTTFGTVNQPSTGTTASTTITGLLNSGGSYLVSVVPVNSFGNGNASTILTGLLCEIPGTIAMNTTLNGQTVALSTTSIPLTWSAVANAQKYVLYSGTTYPITTIATEYGRYTNPWVNVSGLNPGTVYTFQVRVLPQLLSLPGTGTTTISQGTIPNPVSDLTCAVGTLPTATTQVTLNWSLVNGVESYRVYYRVDSRGSTQGTWNLYASSMITGSTVTVTGLSSGISYAFAIMSVGFNSGLYGTSALSNVVKFTTFCVAPTLTIVSNNATAATSSTKASLNLSWTAPVGVSTYVLQMQTGGGSWIDITTSAAGNNNSNEAVVNNLSSGVGYAFQVFALNSNGDTSLAGSTTIGLIPSVPIINYAGIISTSSTISVAWNEYAYTTLPTFTVQYQLVGSGSWITFGTANTATSPTLITGLIAGNNYNIQVQAANIYGSSGYVQATWMTLPSQAIGLSSNTITINSFGASWSGATGATSYEVFVQPTLPSIGNAVLVGVYSGTTATINNLITGQIYNWWVTAVNPAGFALASSVSQVALGVLPPVPNAVTFSSITATSFIASWIQGTYPYTTNRPTSTYTLQYRDDSVNTWSLHTGTNISASTATVTHTYAGAKRHVQVSAVNSFGKSSFSSNSIVIMPPDIPIITLSSRTSTSITLSLNVATPTLQSGTYTIYGAVSGNTLISIGTVNYTYNAGTGNMATFVYNTGVTPNTMYQFSAEVTSIYGVKGTLSDNVSFATPPGDPSTLTYGSGSETNMTLTWIAGATRSGYTNAYVVKVVNNTTNVSTTVQASTTSLTTIVTGLSSNTRYYYTVQTLGANGLTSNVVQSSVFTTAPLAVTGLTTSSIGLNNITLIWNTSTGATYYELWQSSGGPVTLVNGNITTNSYNVTGLTTNTVYSYTVYARSNTYATNQTASTYSSKTGVLPSTPGTISLNGSTLGRTIPIQWIASSDATMYTIVVKQGSTTIATIPNITVTNYTVTGLTNNTLYSISVTAYNTYGNSSAASASFNTITGPTSASLSITSITTTNAILNFNSTSTSPVKYSFTIIQTNNNAVIIAATTVIPSSGTSTSYTIPVNTLKPNFDYKVTSYAFNDTSYQTSNGAISDAVLDTLPSDVTTFTSNAVNNTSVNLAWSVIDTTAGTSIVLTNNSSGVQVGTAPYTNGNVNINSLTAGTTYTFACQTIGTYKNAINKPTTIITTPAVLPLASPPTNVIVNGTTASINLQWTAGANAVSYNVYWTYNSVAQPVLTGRQTNQNYTLGSPGLYVFYVASVGNGTTYNSNPSAYTMSSTYDVSLPGMPNSATGLTWNPSVNGLSGTLSWTAPTGTSGTYRVYYSTSGTNSSTQTVTGTSYTFTGFTSASDAQRIARTFYVSAQGDNTNFVGYGPNTFMNWIDPTPQGLTSENLSTGGVLLTWTCNNPLITKWRIAITNGSIFTTTSTSFSLAINTNQKFIVSPFSPDGTNNLYKAGVRGIFFAYFNSDATTNSPFTRQFVNGNLVLPYDLSTFSNMSILFSGTLTSGNSPNASVYLQYNNTKYFENLYTTNNVDINQIVRFNSASSFPLGMLPYTAFTVWQQLNYSGGGMQTNSKMIVCLIYKCDPDILPEMAQIPTGINWNPYPLDTRSGKLYWTNAPNTNNGFDVFLNDKTYPSVNGAIVSGTTTGVDYYVGYVVPPNTGNLLTDNLSFSVRMYGDNITYTGRGPWTDYHWYDPTPSNVIATQSTSSTLVVTWTNLNPSISKWSVYNGFSNTTVIVNFPTVTLDFTNAVGQHTYTIAPISPKENSVLNLAKVTRTYIRSSTLAWIQFEATGVLSGILYSPETSITWYMVTDDGRSTTPTTSPQQFVDLNYTDGRWVDVRTDHITFFGSNDNGVTWKRLDWNPYGKIFNPRYQPLESKTYITFVANIVSNGYLVQWTNLTTNTTGTATSVFYPVSGNAYTFQANFTDGSISLDQPVTSTYRFDLSNDNGATRISYYWIPHNSSQSGPTAVPNTDQVPTTPSSAPTIPLFYSNSVDVTWQQDTRLRNPTNAYTVSYRVKGTTPFSSVNVTGYNTLTTRITGLIVNTTYQIGLQYVNNIGSSNMSSLIEFTTKSTNPNPPTNLDFQVQDDGYLYFDLPSGASSERCLVTWNDNNTGIQSNTMTATHFIGTNYSILLSNLVNSENNLFPYIITLSLVGDGITYNNGSYGPAAELRKNLVPSISQFTSISFSPRDSYGNTTMLLEPSQPNDNTMIVVMIRKMNGLSEAAPPLFDSNCAFVILYAGSLGNSFPTSMTFNVAYGDYYLNDSSDVVPIETNSRYLIGNLIGSKDYTTGDVLNISAYLCNRIDDSQILDANNQPITINRQNVY